ncbi:MULTISPECIES: copper-binding protein [unclassified Variovorax]|jgi:Cu/Ag efflux protein CusF|uniref:copper-binding protein n=1 Tax=unclassified Variovorax TaxID=663243 RepID=UPI000F7E0991|nr:MULTISPECIES: copper-binding protein [unclassified Variovorax]RSZ40926.1 copper-binding protein [Variovorax sp. 553]RSZ42165.1 copper-binding protein [Variovorax sp. 679]
MSNARLAFLALAAALSFAGPAGAQSTQPSAEAPAAAATELAEGEIRKIDKDNRKLTIRHGPLKNLDMPGMTMVFGVKDDAMLDKVEVGSKVRFEAEKIDGRIVVTKLEATR